jgi:HlyD family secretion protein
MVFGLVLAVLFTLTLATGAALAQSPEVRPATPLGVARMGVVQAVTVADGAHVTAGQALVTLDCTPIEKEIDVRAANLAAAEAVYDRVVNGPRPEEIAIGEAGVGVATARAEEAPAARERAGALEIGVSITRAQLVVAERDSRVADTVLVDARKKLALLKAGSRAEDIAEARARRDSVAASLDEGKAELDQCTVRAPAAGTVKLSASVGELFSIYAPAPLVRFTPDVK